MAVYKIFPEKDATLYSFYPYMNTGIDAIIECVNLNVNINPVPQVSRFLVAFDQDEINSVIDNEIGNQMFSSSLRTYIATAQGVVFDTYLELFPVSGSWNNGCGTYLDSPITTNGGSRIAQTFSGSGGQDWKTLEPYTTYATASFTSSTYAGGGTWYTGSSDPNHPNLAVTQSFTLRSDKDLNMPVTDIVKVWYSGSKGVTPYTNIQNNGFIVKWEDSVEFNTADAIQPVLQFYSVDTNTIYPPVLELKWDDQSFETGSLPEIATTDLYVALDSNPGVFFSGSINRFRLNVRPDFPTRTFQTASIDTKNHFLNSGSTYAIKDLDTNEFVVDYDDQFTKISCDSQSNYFDVYMNGLQPERYYQILIKTTISGSTIIMDDQYYFKVVNG